jgi:hypothetical protein
MGRRAQRFRKLCVDRDQLQAFPAEFVFCHNRRKQPMAAFRTLLGLGTGHKSTAHNEMGDGIDDVGILEICQSRLSPYSVSSVPRFPKMGGARDLPVSELF